MNDQETAPPAADLAHADAKAEIASRRRGGARGDPRPLAPHPCPPGGRVRGAPGRDLGRRGAGTPRLRRGASRGPPRDRGSRPARRRTGRRRAAHRDPRRIRRAARPRPRLRPQHDGRQRRRRGHRARRRSRPGSHGEVSSSARPAEERGSGKQFMIDDGLFDGLDAALLYHPCDRSHVETQRRSPARTSRSPSRASSPTPRPIPGRVATPSTR